MQVANSQDCERLLINREFTFLINVDLDDSLRQNRYLDDSHSTLQLTGKRHRRHEDRDWTVILIVDIVHLLILALSHDCSEQKLTCV